jgi:CDP-glucose 4,6-dehydratase
LEDVALNFSVEKRNPASLRAVYAGKRVLVTGHTGFKGGWLTVWLNSLGADVTGLALEPNGDPSFFSDVGVIDLCHHNIGDIRDADLVRTKVHEARPDIIFHLAAQPLVRRSYDEPLETLQTNVMGTANVLEAVRAERRPCAVVVVTSDKCYENREWVHGYRENDPMGGHDVYSMSKGATELVVQSWRESFFPPERLGDHGVALASARAGNVIGGGDWAKDRIVPDAVRALAAGKPVPVRNPGSVRPWQHVLEPLGGYLLLGARLLGGEAPNYCEAWNFGPAPESTRPVSDVVRAMVECWGSGSWVAAPEAVALHEAGLLRLSIEKAFARLGWSPLWGLREAVARTAEWYRAREDGARGKALRQLSLRQIEEYLRAAPKET